MKSTLGEIIFASVLSAVAAALTAVWGFAGAALFYGYLLGLSAKAVEPSPLLCPAAALVMSVVVFVIVFRMTVRYGKSSSRPSGE